MDKSININNSQLDSSNLNSGSHVKQSLHAAQELDPQIILQLLQEIQLKIDNTQERTAAAEQVQELEEAIKESNPQRAKKIFGWLPEAIRTTASGLTIAKYINLL